MCVTNRQRGCLLTGDLKLVCTLLNFENGVLGREGMRGYVSLDV